MEVGKYNTLKVERINEGGARLTDGKEETYLPGSEIPQHLKEGDDIEVFVYNSQKHETRATLMKPTAELGDFAVMEVVDVNRVGAFLDWGIPKDLMVPPGTQKFPLEKGDKTIVYIAQDSRKSGIIGFTDIKHFVDWDFSGLKSGQQVSLLVWGMSPLGANVIVDNKYSGLIYKQDMDKPLEIGDELPGWIRRIRKDGKLDIGLWEKNIEKIDSFKDRLMDALDEAHGVLPYTDKTDPMVFRSKLNMSKRVYKMAVGMLNKEGKIEIHDTGIVLPGKTPPVAKAPSPWDRGDNRDRGRDSRGHDGYRDNRDRGDNRNRGRDDFRGRENDRDRGDDSRSQQGPRSYKMAKPEKTGKVLKVKAKADDLAALVKPGYDPNTKEAADDALKGPRKPRGDKKGRDDKRGGNRGGQRGDRSKGRSNEDRPPREPNSYKSTKKSDE